MSPFEAARAATADIGLAVMATTFSLVVIFIPVSFMSSISGRFLYQFGITAAVAVLVSLLVSFTLDPMLSSRWHDPDIDRTGKRHLVARILDRFNGGFDRTADRYRSAIAWALGHRKTILALAALAPLPLAVRREDVLNTVFLVLLSITLAQSWNVLAGYAGQVNAKKAETIGTASEALCLVRVPGESTNRSGGVAGCETANTLTRGSDAAQVVAEAFLAGSLAADIAIQNAGGVRIAVPAGTISMNTAFTLLPFTNVLVELPMTGQQVIDVLEDAVANHLDLRVEAQQPLHLRAVALHQVGVGLGRAHVGRLRQGFQGHRPAFVHQRQQQAATDLDALDAALLFHGVRVSTC